MDLVAGAMGNLTPKLLQLLGDEYKLQKGIKAQVESLANELKSVHVALCKVAWVPYDQLDPQVKLWAIEAREASYDMEDILDTFLVRADGGNLKVDGDKGKVARLVEKMGKMFNISKFKARHEIAVAIEDIKKQVDEMAKRRDRCKVDGVVANSATTTSIDPRISMTHKKALELVGIDKPKDALINMLTMGDDDASDKETEIVSIVGSGGLGKTTLAKVVYDKLTVDMGISHTAFVPVGRNPDLKKVFRDILLNLDKSQYMNKIDFLMILDERQLMEEIQAFLKEKRYFIVIDDVWDVPSWEVIRTALQDNNLGSKIMITTRHNDVAKLVHCTYEIKPLCTDSSKILFYGRIFGSQDNCPERFSELSDKILKKCDGVPLAIITIASLLEKKKDDMPEWQEVCTSIGSGLGSNNDMRKILLLSYYDLPSHMKTCFLYLSMYPEDYEIDRDRLIWRWISEGFIQSQKKGDDLFELGKSYFNDLINRSLVQPVEKDYEIIYACRVHDMILDLICSLSREENFVTTSDDIEQVMSLESKKVRRLSLKSTPTWPIKGISQVRSIVVFPPSIDSSMLSFSCLDMLRVLDLEGCALINCRGSNKLPVGNLIHLRYLGLIHTGLGVVPEGIEKLQFLQVLKMSPHFEPVTCRESIFELRRLMCLEGVHCCPWPGNLLRNLASLQVLDTLYLRKDIACTLEALGHLTQVTKLKINFNPEIMVDQSICDTFINSLANLSRLQNLHFVQWRNNLINWERWAPSPHLRRLKVYGFFSRVLPKWISPASLPHIAYLEIMVHVIQPQCIQILGTLPQLTELYMSGNRENYTEQSLQKFVVSAHAFPHLRYCRLNRILIVPSMFTRGAMPHLELFKFTIRATDFFSNQCGFDFDDLAMNHLPSLRRVEFDIFSERCVTGKEEATKLKYAVYQARDVYPNHLEVSMMHLFH